MSDNERVDLTMHKIIFSLNVSKPMHIFKKYGTKQNWKITYKTNSHR